MWIDRQERVSPIALRTAATNRVRRTARNSISTCVLPSCSGKNATSIIPERDHTSTMTNWIKANLLA